MHWIIVDIGIALAPLVITLTIWAIPIVLALVVVSAFPAIFWGATLGIGLYGFILRRNE